jgi:O-antigen/teichoic acid export membrane protein
VNAQQRGRAATRIARNAFLNFLGMMIPLALAVIVVPMLVREFGTDRFGVLALIWGVFSYFTVMDFGLGRALTHAVAKRLDTNQEHEIHLALSYSLLLISAVALLFTGLGIVLAQPLVDHVLAIPEQYRSETIQSFQLLAAGLILVATSSALNGYLAAFERFDLVNSVKVPMVAATLCAPLLAIGRFEPIVVSTAAMLIVRVAAWLVLMHFCHRVTSSQPKSTSRTFSGLRSLLLFGGWISIANVINPILAHADRWALAAWASLAAVTYYSIPSEVATKLWIIPGALAAAMFPAFCRASNHPTTRESESLLYFGTGYTMAIAFAPTLVLTLYAENILGIWLGREFAAKSSLVFQLLLIGAFVNSLAHTSANLLQAHDHPHWIVYLLLAELPIFLLALWLLVPSYGAVGTAMVWTARIALDSAGHWFLARRSLGEANIEYTYLGVFLFLFLMLLGAALLADSMSEKFFWGCVGLVVLLTSFLFLNRRAKSFVATAAPVQ